MLIIYCIYSLRITIPTNLYFPSLPITSFPYFLIQSKSYSLSFFSVTESLQSSPISSFLSYQSPLSVFYFLYLITILFFIFLLANTIITIFSPILSLNHYYSGLHNHSHLTYPIFAQPKHTQFLIPPDLNCPSLWNSNP